MRRPPIESEFGDCSRDAARLAEELLLEPVLCDVVTLAADPRIPAKGAHFMLGHDGRAWWLPGWRSSWRVAPERRGRRR